MKKATVVLFLILTASVHAFAERNIVTCDNNSIYVVKTYNVDTKGKNIYTVDLFEKKWSNHLVSDSGETSKEFQPIKVYSGPAIVQQNLRDTTILSDLGDNLEQPALTLIINRQFSLLDPFGLNDERTGTVYFKGLQHEVDCLLGEYK